MTDPAADPAPPAVQPAPPHPGRGGRWFAWTFGGAGIAVIVCCAGCMSWISNSETTDDPAAVSAAAAGILSVELPARFTPDQATHVPPPPVVGWFVDMTMDWAAYSTAGGGQLVLSRQVGGRSTPDVAGIASQWAGGEVRTVTAADGRAVDYAFGESRSAVESSGGPPKKLVFGGFREGNVIYVVDLSLPPDEYDPAEVTALLKSLAVPAGD